MKELASIQFPITDIFDVVKGSQHEVRRNDEGKFAIFVLSPGWYKHSPDGGISFERNEAGEYQHTVFEDNEDASEYLRVFGYEEKEEDVWVQPGPSEEERKRQNQAFERMLRDPNSGKGPEHFPFGY